ncbi:probable transmembrane reductase CYB561D1 isoform X2 [Hylaeus anthracinus]|nr:probable transmembrane reductase CYB561D1 isoform X2 [Hylaeus anthracinus]
MNKLRIREMKDLPAYMLNDIKVSEPSTSASNTSIDFDRPQSKRSVYSICVTAIDVVNHILIICMTAFLLSYTAKSFEVIDLHVTLCTLGYVLLMSEAIVVLAGESILTNFLSRRAKSHIHWILQVLGLICIIGGVVVMYRAKKNIHFSTIHAKLGIASLAITIFLTICGYPVLVAAKLRKLIRPVIIKFGHNFLGIACFVIGMASQCTGLNYSTMEEYYKARHSRVVSIIVTALITILTLRGALVSLSRQFVAMFK